MTPLSGGRCMRPCKLEQSKRAGDALSFPRDQVRTLHPWQEIQLLQDVAPPCPAKERRTPAQKRESTERTVRRSSWRSSPAQQTVKRVRSTMNLSLLPVLFTSIATGLCFAYRGGVSPWTTRQTSIANPIVTRASRREFPPQRECRYSASTFNNARSPQLTRPRHGTHK